MPKPDALLDPEVLKTQSDGMTDDQQDAMQAKMATELWGVKDDTSDDFAKVEDDKVEKPSKGTEKTDDSKDDAKDDDSEDKDKDTHHEDADDTEKTGDKKEKEEPRDKEKVEDKEKEKDKTDGKTKDKPTQEMRVKSAMQEYDMSEDDATEFVGHIDRITAKYQGNPEKMASAILSLHRMHQKALNDLELSKKLQPDETIHPETKQVIKREALKKELVEKFRKEYPKMTEDWDDDRVVEEIKIRVQTNLKERGKEKQEQLLSEAKSKRTALISDLSESDKKYLPDIKPILDKVDAGEILRDDFEIKPLILMAKGKYFDQSVKDAEERGYKRGLEKAQIEDKGAGGPKGSAGGKKTKTVTLSDDEKEQALNMYQDANISDEKKFENFQELKDLEARKKKEFGR